MTTGILTPIYGYYISVDDAEALSKRLAWLEYLESLCIDNLQSFDQLKAEWMEEKQ